MYDNDQARKFIAALTGSSSSPVTFQVFYDPKPPFEQKKIAATWTSSFDKSLKYIDSQQELYCGLYMTINETDGVGREESNIVKLRAFFVDFDGQEEPTWRIKPHLVQRRDPTHGHAFWLINQGDLDNESWTKIQKQIAMFYGSDTQVIDPCRVLRVPGSLHFKDPYNPKTYVIEHDESATLPKYEVADVLAAHPLNADQQIELDKWWTNRQNRVTGVGYEDAKLEMTKFGQFIENGAHPAVEGQGGTHELYRVACYGHDHGVSLETATQLLWEKYNPRCQPVWAENEQKDFNAVVARAYKYAASEPGCKTAKAAFNSIPMEEPTCGWEKQTELFKQPDGDTRIDVAKTTELIEKPDSGRLTKNEAEILSASLNAKSAHFDLARVFDGIVYQGTNIIRFDKQFYEFNGRSWSKIDDELIKSQIQRMLMPYKPSDSMTSGVFKVFCTLVTREPVDNGTWLNNPGADTSNYAVFKNGIVDLGADTLELIPHSFNYFCLNELDYDFVPGAQCNRWLTFLQSIWGDDESLKHQLKQFLGYCLTNDTSLQKFALFKGKPRSGKGTITDVLSDIVGRTNISAPSLSDLNKDSSLDRMSTSAIALIPDAHSVHISVRDAVLSKFKAITGEDSINFHRMYKGSCEVKFTCKIILSTNNMPQFNDPSGALVARMLVFPFYKSFIGHENTNLKHELHAELEGILQWAIEGLRELRANNNKFTEAKRGIDEKDEIREDMFPLGSFVSESCSVDASHKATADDLYNGYRMWGMSHGVKNPMSIADFVRCLLNSPLPIVSEKTATGDRMLHGVQLKENSVAASAGFDNVALMPIPQMQG